MPPLVRAAENTPAAVKPDPINHGVFSFYFENDLFGGTDQHYTNGVRLSWTSPDLKKFGESRITGPFGGLVDDLPWLSNPAWQRNVAVVLGQNMYTPADIQATEWIEDDRPYAGWLYTGLGFIWKNTRVRNSLTLNIGIVGPSAYAQETQDLVHELRDIPKARGWDNQLHDELGVVLGYQRTWRWPWHSRRAGWDWETLPFAGANLGNVNISASAGAELRFGYNLPDDFGTETIGPAATTTTPMEGAQRAARGRWSDFGTHFFLRAEGRAVARDIFLDGNTFSDSHSVDKLPFTADLSAGISVNRKDVKLTYAYVYRTEEFRGQDGGQSFGSLTLSIPF
ncbi:MAG: lipid A deacylase LpxR family protein [Verrucomicrobiota bacterium]